MKKIKIFVAGSKELVAQRNAIKSVISDLNTEYEHRDINLKMFSYENYSDNQTAYNKFIVEDADMVIFILEGEIRSKTEEELLLASKEFNKSGRPEISIFVRKSDGDELSGTPQMNYVKGLLKGAVDKYYKNYSEKDDYQSLKDGVKQCIRSYVNDEKKRKRKNFKCVCKRLIMPMASLLLCLFALAAGYFYYEANKNESLLLIAGGGSAKNYVEANYLSDELKIEDYGKGSLVYVPMASKTAWPLLREEYLHSKDGTSRMFYPVCISAAELTMDDPVFNDVETDTWAGVVGVVGIWMGNDELTVYEVGDIGESYINKGKISKDNIAKLIKESNDKGIKIYATSNDSGTLAEYENLLDRDVCEMLLNNRIAFLPDMPYNDGDKAIYLGSGVYKPQVDLDGKEISVGKVFDGDKAIFKPTFIYFIVYTNKDHFILPPEIYSFLNWLSTSERLSPTSELNDFLCNKVREVDGNHYIKTKMNKKLYRVGDIKNKWEK